MSANWSRYARTALVHQLQGNDEEVFVTLLRLNNDQLGELDHAADALREKCGDVQAARWGESSARHRFKLLGLDVPLEEDRYNRGPAALDGGQPATEETP
jgi:hypothetical protein